MSVVVVPGSDRVASITWEVALSDSDETVGHASEVHVFDDEDEAYDFLAEHIDSDITKRVVYLPDPDERWRNHWLKTVA